ncbi:MAG: glucoamylase family protein [Acidobacteriaceae bacterium]
MILALLAAPVLAATAPPQRPRRKTVTRTPVRPSARSQDQDLLDQTIIFPAALYFSEQADRATGIIKDRAYNTGYDTREIGSIAATGFGLTGLCIAAHRKLLPIGLCQEQIRRTLRYFARSARNEHGFFYHFINTRDGSRLWACELSSVDTAILLCGILTARQAFFADTEIRQLASAIYERVDWPWMMNSAPTLCHGWKPEGGFLPGYWEHYSELMMIYLLAIGSPTHPIPAESWDAWTRPQMDFQGIRYIGASDPLFVHQFSHAWFDFRDKRDRYTNYFRNSVKATNAHRLFCLSLHDRLPEYGAAMWGVSASDSQRGYTIWGGPPMIGNVDGTIVPCAAAGSLPFLPAECAAVMRNISTRHPTALGRYGFTDAFNLRTKWYDSDVLGIDLGISMLMAENLRSQYVWNTFMSNPEVTRAMELVGFEPDVA